MSTAAASAVDLVPAVCRELIRMAKAEEDRAAAEAALTPYWAHCPVSVLAHRAAARVMRDNAHLLEAEARRLSVAS